MKDYPGTFPPVPKRLLAGFTGVLHTDGYSGYAPVVREQGPVRLSCWAFPATRQ